MDIIIDKPHISQLPTLRRLWQNAFGDDDLFLDNFFRTAFSTERCRVAITGHDVVAALYWFDCLHNEQPVAYIYAVTTDETFCGKGICHKLMDNTHCHLKAHGYKAAMLVPGSAQLFDFYKSMGYITTCYIDTFSCDSSTKKVKITSVKPNEYATLRRKFLPENALIQDNENIAFLSTQAEMFAGNDFLLAAHIKNHSLFGIEFLGNKTVAPDILNSLNCFNGTFRTPGTTSPFAMHLSLVEPQIAPTYLGLAFD